MVSGRTMPGGTSEERRRDWRQWGRGQRKQNQGKEPLQRERGPSRGCCASEWQQSGESVGQLIPIQMIINAVAAESLFMNLVKRKKYQHKKAPLPQVQEVDLMRSPLAKLQKDWGSARSPAHKAFANDSLRKDLLSRFSQEGKENKENKHSEREAILNWFGRVRDSQVILQDADEETLSTLNVKEQDYGFGLESAKSCDLREGLAAVHKVDRGVNTAPFIDEPAPSSRRPFAFQSYSILHQVLKPAPARRETVEAKQMRRGSARVGVEGCRTENIQRKVNKVRATSLILRESTGLIINRI